jgi:hypothetical protein
MEWEVGIPGKTGVSRNSFLDREALFDREYQTPWEGGVYKLMMNFTDGAFAGKLTCERY